MRFKYLYDWLCTDLNISKSKIGFRYGRKSRPRIGQHLRRRAVHAVGRCEREDVARRDGRDHRPTEDRPVRLPEEERLL